MISGNANLDDLEDCVYIESNNNYTSFKLTGASCTTRMPSLCQKCKPFKNTFYTNLKHSISAISHTFIICFFSSCFKNTSHMLLQVNAKLLYFQGWLHTIKHLTCKKRMDLFIPTKIHTRTTVFVGGGL